MVLPLSRQAKKQAHNASTQTCPIYAPVRNTSATGVPLKETAANQLQGLPPVAVKPQASQQASFKTYLNSMMQQTGFTLLGLLLGWAVLAYAMPKLWPFSLLLQFCLPLAALGASALVLLLLFYRHKGLILCAGLLLALASYPLLPYCKNLSALTHSSVLSATLPARSIKGTVSSHVFRLAQLQLEPFTTLQQAEETVTSILAEPPTVLSLTGVTLPWQRYLEGSPLRQRFPYWESSSDGLMVLSSAPIISRKRHTQLHPWQDDTMDVWLELGLALPKGLGLPEEDSFFRQTLKRTQTPQKVNLRLLVLETRSPFTDLGHVRQEQLLSSVAQRIKALQVNAAGKTQAPLIILGRLNTSPWEPVFKAFRAAVPTLQEPREALGVLLPTQNLNLTVNPLLDLPIGLAPDHILPVGTALKIRRLSLAPSTGLLSARPLIAELAWQGNT
jgi:hypothetical protein